MQVTEVRVLRWGADWISGSHIMIKSQSPTDLTWLDQHYTPQANPKSSALAHSPLLLRPQEPSQPSQKPLDVSTTSTDAQPAAASAVSTASRPRGRPRGKPSATEASTSAAPQTSPSTSPSEPSQPSQPSHPSQPSQPSQPATAEPAAEVANQLSPGLQSPSLRRRPGGRRVHGKHM